MPKYTEEQNQKHVKQIQALAEKHNAMVTSTFSQMIGEARVILNSNAETEGGICAALSNQWIIDHAKEGSLWNTLYRNGTLDKVALKRVCAQFCADARDRSGRRDGTIQSANMVARMARFGIIARSRVSDGKAPLVPMRQTNVPYGAKRMGADPLLGTKVADAMKAFVSHGLGVGSYVHLSIFDGASSEVGAHSIAMHLGGTARRLSGASWDLPFSDITLFDPNYGEFWFGTRQQHRKDNPSVTRTKVGDFRNFLQECFDRAYPDFGGFRMTCFAPKAF